MRDANKKSFLEWASHSLIGHVAFFQITFSLSITILFLGLGYSDGTLTPIWALYTIFISSIIGLIIAILIWYTVSLPLIKRYKKTP